MDSETILELGERVAVLEVKYESMHDDLDEIKGKLDELLHLKSKGMGALWLISLLIGSGMLGLILTVASFFNRSHL